MTKAKADRHAAEEETLRKKAGEETPEQDPEKEQKKDPEQEQKQDAPPEEKTPPEPEGSEPEESPDTKYLRLMADFQNYRRRVEKEKSDIYAYAAEKIVNQLLEVMDNFERALEHMEEEGPGNFSEGMAMIYKQLKGVLEKNGVEAIEAQGMPFDPNFHNAVMTEESDSFESGTVTEVLQKGYLLNKKVIRPSMVKVAR